MAHSRDLRKYFTPAVILSRVSLSAPVERPQSSSVREVHVNLLKIKLDVAQMALPLALVAVPRWDAIPKVCVFTYVAVLTVLARRPAAARF